MRNAITCPYVRVIALIGILIFLPKYGSAADLGADAIMERNFFVMKVATINNTILMKLMAKSGGVRERKMDVAGKLQQNGIDSNLVIRFQYPPDISGSAFLVREQSQGDDDMWVYLPALHRSRRIVASNKKDSFFGSDFSYGDILPPKPSLFRDRLTGSEMVDGNDCYIIESVPRDEREKGNFGYSRKILWIRKDNFLENKIEYYDLQGQLLKTQLVSEHVNVDSANQKWIARRREMINHQTGHKTVLIFDHIQVGNPIPDSHFTTNALERNR